MIDRSLVPGNVMPGKLLLRTADECDFYPQHLVEVFREQRQRFAAILHRFGSEDWATPTRCADWSAHGVIRHLCDCNAIAAGTDDHALDIAAGFDPRITPQGWLAASAGESPGATLGRFEATTAELLVLARDRLAQGRTFDVCLPYGPMDWTVLLLHAFWDSWIHERDVLLARAEQHPTSADAISYATAYGLFIAAAVASMHGDQVRETLTLGGDGGGVFDLDIRGPITLTVTRGTGAGPPAAEVADALAGRAPTVAALGDLPTSTRAALWHLANFFNTRAEKSPPQPPRQPLNRGRSRARSLGGQ
jgi:uncharacterized protein (TIGR03083 family)